MTWQSLRVNCVLAPQRPLAVSASSTNFGSAISDKRNLRYLPAAACSQQILHVVFVGNRDRAVFGGRKPPRRPDLNLDLRDVAARRAAEVRRIVGVTEEVEPEPGPLVRFLDGFTEEAN
jgi:hypothetical protein